MGCCTVGGPLAVHHVTQKVALQFGVTHVDGHCLCSGKGVLSRDTTDFSHRCFMNILKPTCPCGEGERLPITRTSRRNTACFYDRSVTRCNTKCPFCAAQQRLTIVQHFYST